MKKKHFFVPSLLFLVFLTVAITLWLTKNNIFYLFNFSYIGFSVAIGTFLGAVLPKRKKQKGRLVTQFLVGLYMFFFLGIYGKENMQIEGFFTYLFMGVFLGSTIHYLVAKIGGTVIFGRGWCGYACWTMTLLDLLPWKKPKEGRVLSTECISCSACIHACPTDAIVYTAGIDGGLKEYLRYQGEPVATKKSRRPKEIGA